MSGPIGTKANKKPRDPSKLETQLDRQIAFLKRSCAHFDQGDHDEAIRLAVTLRVLLHDTSQSHSLMKQMGLKDKLYFLDTGVYPDALDEALAKIAGGTSDNRRSMGHVPSMVGLVEIGTNQAGQFGWYAPLRPDRFHPGSPRAEATRRPQPFEAWWNDPLIESSTGKRFSRWHLIQIMANQDGGAHVDVGLDEDYNDLCIDFLNMWAQASDQPMDHLLGQMSPEMPAVENNVAFASVRQVAYEFLITLERHFAYRERPGLYALREPYDHLPQQPIPHIVQPAPTVFGFAYETDEPEAQNPD